MNLKIEYVSTNDLKTYENNAKIHTGDQIEQIKKSIQEFGMNDPIAVWKDNVIIEGHGRLIACLELGIDKVPIIRLDNLSDEQRKAYALVHNKLTMNTGFEFEILMDELDSIENIDMSLYSFNFDETEEFKERRTLSDDFTIETMLEVKGEEKELEKLYDELTERGFVCRVL